MTEEFDRWRIKCTERSSIPLGVLKDEATMLAMFAFVCTGNYDIINVHEGEIETTKHLVHETLGCLSCSSQAKRHTEEFA